MARRTSAARRSKSAALGRPTRKVNYRQLTNPFPAMELYSADHIASMHEGALDILQRLGIKVLLPEAREVLAKAGARVDDEMVFFGRDMVEAAIGSAPKDFVLKGGSPERDVRMALGSLVFQCGAGCPNVTDNVRGRRAGTGADFIELLRLNQHFDAMHLIPPMVEPQDIPVNLRHYFTMQNMLVYTDKPPFTFARGTQQAEESFEMLQNFRGLSDDQMQASPHTYTIINSNSPRMLDLPMAQGLIDFARHKQMAIITPFTLMGAMAPISVAGAVMLSHAEALAGITLNQMVNPGAPICYGTFTSNVDMKSGAPTFGTPAQFQASIAAGQLARHFGLPWRCAAGSTANLNDVQAANENQLGLWGCLMAGATLVLHSAGWLEGGLTFGYEKFISDMEVINSVADLCQPVDEADPMSHADLGMDAIEAVEPGGHFFAALHTMDRYQSAFYTPTIATYQNHGTWTANGSQDTDRRAEAMWQEILAEPKQRFGDVNKFEYLERYVASKAAKDGADALN